MANAQRDQSLADYPWLSFFIPLDAQVSGSENTQGIGNMSNSGGNPYLALGLPQPKRTFLDSRKPIGSGGYGAGLASSGQAPQAANAGNEASAPRNTDAVILGEHKVELTDMLQESIATLKNVYRSKFVFGEHLKFVDPSFSGDTVSRFNLTTPPSFDPAYSQNLQSDNTASPTIAANPQQQAGDAGDNSANSREREKMRTAEELIKKLYRRNNQLEVENKYYKSEIQRFERLAGLGRTPAHTLTCFDGHLPVDNPLYTAKQRRNCRSCPPSRTMLRTAVKGYGLTFPSRNPNGEEDAAPPREEPPVVAALKKRVMQLTEALVTIQHENEKMTQEKIDRLTLRDNMLKRYICDRDTFIAQLHTQLQELQNKVQNPMKLARTRQPSSSMSPVVAAHNVLKEISQRLSENIASAAEDIVKKTGSALPAGAADAPLAPAPPPRPGTAGAVVEAASAAADAVGLRRKELANRLRAIVDNMPVTKRKQLLLVMMELKQLYEALVSSNKSLLQTYEDHMRRADRDMIALKIQVASLRDQLRSMGVSEEEVLPMSQGGGVDSSRANTQAPQPSNMRADP